MGKILPGYKKTIIDEIVNSINLNTSNYYAFVSNPISTINVATITSDDYNSSFSFDWQIIFGKKIQSTDIVPVIKYIPWQSNTVYTRYDNTKDISNTNFYAITPPVITGGTYNVFVCIDNANGGQSIYIPDQIQASSFQKSDGYIWRYLTSISSYSYDRFYSNGYMPLYSNNVIANSAAAYAGIEVIPVTNGGSGYISYNDGTILSTPNSTLIQISSSASSDNDFYKNNSIYIYNTNFLNSQLRVVNSYVSNTSGKWVYLDQPANTYNIFPNVTTYKISPRVIIQCDGDIKPSAYSVINTYSQSVNNIVVINTGTNISWANVTIQSNTIYGNGVTAYAIVPPPGGHGSDVITELYPQGIGLSFKFYDYDANTVPVGTLYNKIGLIKNPYILNTDGTKGSNAFNSSTFDQTLTATLSPTISIAAGTIVYGQNSGSIGTVVFSNTSLIKLTGDKSFINGENITNANGSIITQLNINTLGSIYAKDIKPLYVQNISNVSRANSQTETYKLIVQI